MQKPLLRNSHRSKLFFIIMLLSLLPGGVKNDPFPQIAGEESADVVFDWYKLISRIQRNTAPPPVVLQNYRNFGFIGVGLYEAVQPGIKGAVSLSKKLYQMPAMPEADKDKHYLWGASANAVLASLMKQILVGLTDADKASIDSLEKAYNDRFAWHIPDAIISRSQAFGRAIADAIYNWSTTDNFNLSSVGYVLPVCPSCWVLVPPAPAPVGPFLGNSRPFLASSVTATAPPLPFPYSEDPSSSFYQAAKELYDIGNALTPEQKTIAHWWADFGGPGLGYLAGIHPLLIVTNVLQSKHVRLGQAAEIYAKASIAMKDGIFRTWRSKFHYNLIRPVTYINNIIDPAWASYLPTPPYPEYTSGLVSLYAPSMQVLKRTFGDIPITDNTYVFRGDAARSFDSFSKLVEEVALSRIYGGIHYRFTQNISVEFNTNFGDEVADIKLTLSKHGNEDY